MHLVDVVGRVDASRLQIDAFEDVERLEQHRSLIPRAGLVDVVAVKARRHRLFDRAVERRQIVVGEHAAGGLVGVGDAMRDISGVERVAPGANRRHPVVRLRERRLVGGRDGTERPREVRLPEDLADLRHAAVRIVRLLRPLPLLGRLALAHEEIAEELVHREAVGELNRRLQHLIEVHRALGLQRQRHRVEHRRNRRAERPVAGHETALGEQRGRGRLRRGTLTVDDDDLLRLRVVDHRRRFAAEAEMRNLADRRREHRGDAGVHRVAALLQDANAGGDRVVSSGRDDAVRAENLRPHRVRARARDAGRLGRTLLSADGDRGDRDNRGEAHAENGDPLVHVG